MVRQKKQEFTRDKLDVLVSEAFPPTIYSTLVIRNLKEKTKSVKLSLSPQQLLSLSFDQKQNFENGGRKKKLCKTGETWASGKQAFLKGVCSPHPRPFPCKAHIHKLYYIVYMLNDSEIKSHLLSVFSTVPVIWNS